MSVIRVVRTPVRARSLVARALVVVGLVATLAACADEEARRVIDPGAPAPSARDCAPDQVPPAVTADQVAAADTDGTTLTLVTHDSFAVSDGTLEAFTDETGIAVEVLTAGDTGTMVSQAVLTAGDPVADVMFGIDTTFLCRGTAAGLFVPYRAQGLDDVPADLHQAVDDLATPIDVGDVCLNYSRSAFAAGGGDGPPPPAGLDDLTDPAYADRFVTENPELSSPGFAFLLATIAEYGEDGWERYWKDLRANGLEVAASWDEAYYGSFDAGSGERSVVTSYASSPVADVLYSDPPRDEPAIGVVADACFRQVEFAGILRGTEHPEAAARLVDFLLSPRFQEDIPLNMFVEPANGTARLPAEFTAHRTVIDRPHTLDPAAIEAGRDDWTERWTEIVLR